ncbi:MAG TPA: PIG-L family deacetylase [Acidimicrobiales bacterium]|jgi:LmbE family N-acetylglucosaminyl deacetylase
MTDPIGPGAALAAPSVDLPVPAVALAIGAHPDDIEFGCGGTLAKWAAGGCRIHHLVCTDGAKGSWDPAQDPARLVSTRQEEQRLASRRLGGHGDVTFLGWPDGELESGLRQRGEVALCIRRVRPDVVLGHDPWKRYRLHPDHRHAGFLATDGIVAARDPHFYPEQDEAPHRPDALLLWEADEPDHVENIAGFEQRKLDALLAHRSQFRSTMHITDADEPDAEALSAFVARLQSHHARAATPAGLRTAESFKALRDL